MALNLDNISKQLVKMDSETDIILVVEMPEGPPRFVTYKDLVALLGVVQPLTALHASESRAPERRFKTSKQVQGPRPLTPIGRLLGDIFRAYSTQGKRVPKQFCDELKGRLVEFQGELPPKVNSQVGWLLKELLDEWSFDDSSVKKEIKSFLDRHRVLLTATKKPIHF